MKTEFFVNEEKRTVVCKLSFDDDCCSRYVIRGKAYCSPTDVFSLEIGKRIAETRAHQGYHAHYRDRYAARIKVTEQKLRELQSKLYHHTKILVDLKEKEDNLID